jgi:PAS domain S-box-containing protein
VEPLFARQILDHLAHPIFVKDREFRFVYVNRALCELVGVSSRDMLGKTDYDLFPQEQADSFRAKDLQVFQGCAVAIEDEPITDASGIEHTLATTKVPLRGPDGQITHLVGVIHDISHLAAAIRELGQDPADRRTARQDEDRLKEEFLSLASHELRTPLAGLQLVQGLLRFYAAAGPQADSLLPLLERQQRLLGRLNRLVADLMDMSRIQLGKLAVRLRPVDLVGLLKGVLERGRQSVGARYELVLHAARETMMCMADPGRLVQVFENLLANAYKYAPLRSQVRITARVAGEAAEVVVQDQGPGIPRSMQGRIFERFFQVEAGRSFGGLGLGLYISKALVQAQGGQIWVESVPGKGSAFHVTVPLAPAQQEVES